MDAPKRGIDQPIPRDRGESVKVLVAGGGIGGLSLALSLHAAGFDGVEVFEASPVVEELGVGINVLPHAVRELTELGLADDVAAAGLATGEFVMFNKHGQRIWGEPRGLGAGYRWPQYSIHRGRLLGVLHRAFLERLGAKRMHTGRRVVRCSQDGASVRVEFADGGVAEGDVLVGADGVHSTIRTQLHPDEGPPLWNGITMWRAVARAEPFLSGATMAIVGHFGKRAVIYPITSVGPDGRALINIVLEAKTTEGRPMPRQDWNHAVNRDEVRALFGSMRFDWIDLGMLIETAEQWWQYPMVDRDPLPGWSFGRVTLLGDAAHPMYPVGANGASQAILDARTLAHVLALETTIDAALDTYETTRRPATSAVVLANRQVGAEKCMELAEARAPNGFQRIEDVFAPGELEELTTQYKRTAGFDPATLNERPSLTVAPADRTAKANDSPATAPPTGADL
jgi:2-polyprenyl-6-methoxyphenol hydroxylase-like FAD-dependent oxidoreductase